MNFVHTLNQVSTLNTLFGNPRGTDMEFGPEYIKYVMGQVSLVKEELNDELLTAETTADFLDAIGDTITVADGIIHKAMLDLDLKFAVDTLSKGVVKGLVAGLEVPQPLEDISLSSFILDAYEYEGAVHDLIFEYWAKTRVFAEVACIRAGYDSKKVYDEVHASNMSKFCKDLAEVQLTLDKYQAEYGLIFQPVNDSDDTMSISERLKVTPESDLRVEQVEEVFVIKVNRDLKMDDKAVKAGKFLKGINFKEPDFSDLTRFVLPTVTKFDSMATRIVG